MASNFCKCNRSLLREARWWWVQDVRNGLTSLNYQLKNEPTALKDGLQLGKRSQQRVMEVYEKHGNFTSLVDLLSLPRVGKHICKSLLTEECLQHFQSCLNKAKFLEHHFSDSLPPCVPEIVSVDLGLRNASWVHLNCSLDVIEWKKINTGFPDPYSPDGAYRAMKDFATSLPKASAYILEGQSHRMMGSSGGFMKIGLQLRLQEAMLYTILKSTTQSKVFIMCPKYVAGLLNLKAFSQQHKKKAVVELTNRLVSGNMDVGLLCPGLAGKAPLKLSQRLRDQYNMETKQDDLGDSLMQGLAFYECLASTFLIHASTLVK